ATAALVFMTRISYLKKSSHSISGSPKATKLGFNKELLLYCRGSPSGLSTVPPASSRMQSPAAVSHSLVGLSRKYKSAAPSATRQSLSELPMSMKLTVGHL